MADKPFNYTIDLTSSWPPGHRPKPPFGPTAVEIIRSCPLRVCFESSPGYERRMGFAARVGTAFHRTLQSFFEKPLPPSLDSAMSEAINRFEHELAIQNTEASSRPREARLPRDQDRIDRAMEAILVETHRLSKFELIPHAKTTKSPDSTPSILAESDTQPYLPKNIGTEVEIPVRDREGLFQGRIDYAEHTLDGVILYDYKSALRDDLPERYERQLQLYAAMWHSTRGSWPIQAFILYPLTGATHEVSVHPNDCLEIIKESGAIVQQIQKERNIYNLASPGDTCRICEFRPWCQPFWNWQASESNLALALERSDLGFSGSLAQMDLSNHFWHLKISWRFGEIQFVAPEERFPHLRLASRGQHVRVVDAQLKGLRYAPRAQITDYSELFLLI